ncbi:MAG: hypothetical protein QOF06_116 [Solirubrobacterales bacterium]|nr:hypothetical protein [Solirubrobacterales bacterium]
MTKLNYEKLRHLPRPATGTAGSESALEVKPRRPLDRLEPHMPFSKWCMRCGDEFLYYGAEERPPLIHCCVDCRRDVEEEALLNGLKRDASDDVLVEAVRGIAAAEKQIAEQGYLARRARSAGRRKEANRHRRRMVRASVAKEEIIRGLPPN